MLYPYRKRSQLPIDVWHGTGGARSTRATPRDILPTCPTRSSPDPPDAAVHTAHAAAGNGVLLCARYLQVGERHHVRHHARHLPPPTRFFSALRVALRVAFLFALPLALPKARGAAASSAGLSLSPHLGEATRAQGHAELSCAGLLRWRHLFYPIPLVLPASRAAGVSEHRSFSLELHSLGAQCV